MTDMPIVEWIKNVELVCELCAMGKVKRILPLKLGGGTLAMYRRLSKEWRANIEQIKQALITAYTTYMFNAFNQFVTCLPPGETVDEFLADSLQLAWLVGEPLPDRWMTCAFVPGLPQHVRQLLGVSSQMDAIDPSDIDGSPTNPNMPSESSPEEEEIQTIPLWRSTWNKRPHPHCHLCDPEISGERHRCDSQELESDNEDSLHSRYREYYRIQCRQRIIWKMIGYGVARKRVQQVTEFQLWIAFLFGVALLVFGVVFSYSLHSSNYQ